MQYRITVMPMGMPDAKPLSVVVDSVKNQTAADALLLLAGQMHQKDWSGPEWSKFREDPEMTVRELVEALMQAMMTTPLVADMRMDLDNGEGNYVTVDCVKVDFDRGRVLLNRDT